VPSLLTTLLLSFLSGNKTQPPPPHPKTDKPRPHVCATCSRSFARLEHLKRHERSHTKEKPFECPECTRCFARRDLLLRHQQKLHMTTTPSSRPRASGRRESTSSVTSSNPGRVRKNSVSTTATGPVSHGDGGASAMRARPRANTIAHVDSSTLGMLAAANANVNRGRSNSSAQGNVGGTGVGSLNHEETRYVFPKNTRPWGAWAHEGPRHAVPKIDTSLSSLDLGGMMPRSASMLPSEYELDGLLFGGTVNPAALHFNMSPLQQPIGTPTSPFGPPFPGLDSSYYIEDDDDYEWMNPLGGSLMDPVDQSSPSAFSTTSAGGISEVILNENPGWGGQMGMGAGSGNSINFNSPNDFSGSNFHHETPPPPGTISPKSLLAQQSSHENYYSTSLSISPSTMSHHFPQFNHQYGPNNRTSSATSLHSNGGSSMTSLSAESVTDATRAALLATLAQAPSVFNSQGTQNYQPSRVHQRRYSTSTQPPPGTNFSPFLSKTPGVPSTADLQRYVVAYIKYFHPHLPFLHIPTLNFNSPAFTNSFKGGQRNNGVIGGGGCLVLSIAAIGALYEFEQNVARDIFEASKKTIQIFLEDRRKADVTAALSGLNTNGASGGDSGTNTPVWLVQAMLLNVIYGLQCGDKSACETAVTHCAALVTLARAAGLTRQPHVSTRQTFKQEDGDIRMSDLESYGGSVGSDGWGGINIKMEPDENVEWSSWVIAEERKRTLYAVHFLSSLLVAAHNLSPALMNNEIRCDLPCDEELWSAGTAAVWKSRGGLALASQNSVNFTSALTGLLSAGQQTYGSPGQFQNFTNGQQGGVPPYPPSGIIPSTFGCLVLICALHVYIWETRQRQNSRHWTSSEAEAMHAHIEPALKAWQAAWYSSPHHSIERPNPYAMGPLSADCIPLLDLAYIRLFVDLGRAKEFFWARDYEAMAEEIARGWENAQNNSPSSASSISAHSDSSFSGAISPTSSPASQSPSPNLRPIKIEPGVAPRYSTSSNCMNVDSSSASARRERHLRKAAFYAADSLAMSDALGASSSSTTACRELPIQSALCTFDCAQVLAEWIATVQERVNPYMGVLRSDECNIASLEGLVMLEHEDRKLLTKVMEMLRNAEMKMSVDWNNNPNSQGNSILRADSGLGSKVLNVSAYLLDKAVIWPGIFPPRHNYQIDI